MCIDKRVVGALALVAGGLVLLTPGRVISLLPLLLLAACPLSMLVMGVAMSRGRRSAGSAPNPPLESGVMDNDRRTAALLKQLDDLRGQQRLIEARMRELAATSPEFESDTVLTAGETEILPRPIRDVA